MVKSSNSTESLHEDTDREKRWLYDEYYMGNKDDENRRNGKGENHWSGAESIEWHVGSYFRDTMHGYGDYRWRYKDHEGLFATYEGRFFANQLHGYGAMSYPDGRVFTGLFYKDVRWGPGEERFSCLQSNVGLWRGTQLARLTWRPATPCVAPDFNTGPKGSLFLDPYRIVLRRNVKILGQVNSAVELLKRYGAEPTQASKMWRKLYPPNCTDLESALCHRETFLSEYYHGRIISLEEDTGEGSDDELNSQNSAEVEEPSKYFAWNNSDMMIHMMKHTFKHDNQRKTTPINLKKVLSGPRKLFRPAAKHEYDCRSTIMASYLGHISTVAKLINEEDVYADIADMQGNTALMYAACGDQCEIIHFLIEAGANVNSINDSCCTPLGVALIRYLCVAKDIKPITTVSALLPPVAGRADKATPLEERMATEWNIKRELPLQTDIMKNPSNKTLQSATARKTKSQLSSVTQQSIMRTKRDTIIPKIFLPPPDPEYDSDEDVFFTDDRRQFLTVHDEYNLRVNALFDPRILPAKNIEYMFEVRDLMRDIEADVVADMAKTSEKHPKKGASKVLKDKDVPKSKDQMTLQQQGSLTSADRMKTEMLSTIYMTILRLLVDGADPRMITCPQPGVLMAVKSGCPELVNHLVTHGADINERFPQMLNYTALDIVISEGFSQDTVNMVKALLESGAEVNYRFNYDGIRLVDYRGQTDVLGPTLLHVLLAKKLDFEFQEDIRNQIIELLLQYNADPIAMFNGRTPVDIALCKNITVSDIFINNPGTDLNAIINSSNQSILVKMFTREYLKQTAGVNRFPVLTNILLRGADPLLECYNEDMKYGNIFEFANTVLHVILPKSSPPLDGNSTGNVKGKTSKSKVAIGAKSKIATKSTIGPDSSSRKSAVTSEITEFRENLDLITECARLLHIRWLQAKLVKELIDVIYRYKHRCWNMILKEHKNANNVGLWVNTQRCIEIWDVLKTTKRKRYNEDLIFKHLLCIVQYYQKRIKDGKMITPHMKAFEKNLIESDINGLLKECKAASKLATEVEVWKKIYVKPELVSKNDKKFKICFECSLPLPTEPHLTCYMCQLVTFCNIECLHENIFRHNCHPCSEYIMDKYFPPTPSEEKPV